MATWQYHGPGKAVLETKPVTLSIVDRPAAWWLWGHGDLHIGPVLLKATNREDAKAEAVELVREWCRGVLKELEGP